MKKIIIMMCCTLIGCTQSPEDVNMPTNKSEMHAVQEYIATNLEGEERQLASEALVKHTAFGAVTDKNMTLADAIDKQREINRLEANRIEKREAITKKMNNAIEVVYINHKPIRKDYLGIVGHNIKVKFRNKQDKAIHGVKGKLIFSDVFGKQSGSIGIEHMGVLKKNDNVYKHIMASTIADGYIEDFDYQTKDVVFQPEMIVFSDETALSISNE